MESLSGNWLQWMEMIWSVVKTDEVCFAWVCCGNSNLAWFGFFKMVSTSACVFSILSTLKHIDCGAAA